MSMMSMMSSARLKIEVGSGSDSDDEVSTNQPATPEPLPPEPEQAPSAPKKAARSKAHRKGSISCCSGRHRSSDDARVRPEQEQKSKTASIWYLRFVGQRIPLPVSALKLSSVWRDMIEETNDTTNREIHVRSTLTDGWKAIINYLLNPQMVCWDDILNAEISVIADFLGLDNLTESLAGNYYLKIFEKTGLLDLDKIISKLSEILKEKSYHYDREFGTISIVIDGIRFYVRRSDDHGIELEILHPLGARLIYENLGRTGRQDYNDMLQTLENHDSKNPEIIRLLKTVYEKVVDIMDISYLRSGTVRSMFMRPGYEHEKEESNNIRKRYTDKFKDAFGEERWKLIDDGLFNPIE